MHKVLLLPAVPHPFNAITDNIPGVWFLLEHSVLWGMLDQKDIVELFTAIYTLVKPWSGTTRLWMNQDYFDPKNTKHE